MGREELPHVLIAVLVVFLVAGFSYFAELLFSPLLQILLFSMIIVLVHVVSKELAAYFFDARVEHSIWMVSRFGLKEHHHLKEPVPLGAILPLFFSVFSLGIFKVMPVLTYETRALRRRAARRFGIYSYTAMTDWHNGLIGAAGIIGLLILSVIAYVSDFEYLAKLAVYYSLANIIPISSLDGAHILFGSRIVWTALAIIVALFFIGAFVILV